MASQSQALYPARSSQPLSIVYAGVDSLHAYPRNARTHSKHQIRQIAESIKEFGFTNPVLVDRNNTIVAGHGRVQAAEILGMKEVPIRCAIYTRKSSEEGLEQAFNSLQAQREACEAYIASQKHEGWTAISKIYDDGGFSGGNIERPALQELLNDIAAGQIQTVVVYKVDRLTRSLSDFAKIIEAFDAKGVSFVSVTQQFNTTTSMGRLTLNVLLSFAQFEREVTGERIRDKIAASKRKGMWMGGVVPLGYDLKDHKLFVNPKEAIIVREIFTAYGRLGCVSKLRAYLAKKKIRSKVRISAEGRRSGDVPYSRGALYEVLKNQVYIGRITHKGDSYPGQHEAIVDQALWERTSALLATQNRGRRQTGGKVDMSMLTGLLYDADGNRYTPTHAVKGGKRYRYYTYQAAIQKRALPSQFNRLPAKEVEQLVVSRIAKLFDSPEELIQAVADMETAIRDLKRLTTAGRDLARSWDKLSLKESGSKIRSLIVRVLVREAVLEIEVSPEALERMLLLPELRSTESGSMPPNRSLPNSLLTGKNTGNFAEFGPSKSTLVAVGLSFHLSSEPNRQFQS